MSLRSLLRSVVEWIRPPRRVQPELRITPEQLRAALSEMLADPATRRLVLRDLVGGVFPISGGSHCTTDPTLIFPGAFGSNADCPTTSEFSFPRKLGIGTTTPAQRLEVFESNISLNAVVRVRGANQTDVFLDVYSGTAGQGLFAYGSQPLVFGVDGAEKARIATTGNVGIGTATPQAKLSVGSGSLLDTNLPVQISTGGTGSVAYYGANKNGGYGVLFGFENAGGLGTGGVVRVVTGDPLMFFVNNTTEAMRIISNGNVGIGRTDPLVKLHVKGGNLYIEGPGSVGRLGFLPNDATTDSGATQMWRKGGVGTPDNIHLRTFTNPSTLLALLAPPQSQITETDREATIALSRETTDEKYSEFLDLYNNYYMSEKQYGIRIQRKNPAAPDPANAQFHDFVFDQQERVGQQTPTRFPLMILKASRSVGIGTEEKLSQLTVKVRASFQATGTVTVNLGTPTTVTGDAGPPLTLFTQEVGLGDKITIEAETKKVVAIGSDNSLTVDSNFNSAHTNKAMTVIKSLSRIDDSSGSVKVIVSDEGNVGIGTITPGNILTVVQNSATDPIADAWTTYSSRRWKTNVRSLEGALEKVERLHGVFYDRKEDGKRQIGLVGEEVGEVVPEVVTFEQNGEDARSVDYARLTALLIEAVKEQQEQIREVRREVEAAKIGAAKASGKTNTIEGSSILIAPADPKEQES